MKLQNVLRLFMPSYLVTLIYMLQASEYSVVGYLGWYWRTSDFSEVMHRKKVTYTPKALLLTMMAVAIASALLIVGIVLLITAIKQQRLDLGVMAVGLLLLSPVITAHALIVPLWIGTVVVQKPKTASSLSQAQDIFANHPGATIAVAGSYGKTTTKEVLKTVLGQKLTVAATPANLNTPLALAAFAESLEGNEDILVIELGEFKPGDIAEFAELIRPDAAIITGLAQVHLDTLSSLETAAQNLLSLAKYVEPDALFINADSEKLTDFTADVEHLSYSADEALGWKTSKIKISLDGTSFTIKKGKTTIKAESKLLGRHSVGVLTLAAALAKAYKLSKSDIEKGIAQTEPFEHRLQVTRQDTITIIDDTYNGNIEGVRAGINLVADQTASRKVYVTPGLVELGDQAATVNAEVGRLAAPVFDAVVLMNNNQTDAIVEGLHAAGFAGVTTIVDDPLEFYNNMEAFTSDGDLVLMQNDLPDNYQ